MAQGKQAKTLTPKQEQYVLHHLRGTRYPDRDKVMFLLSMKAGLRAKEIAALTWDMIVDSSGEVGEAMYLPDSATKGASGRTIPLNSELRRALRELYDGTSGPVIRSERGGRFSAAVVQLWFHRLYKNLDLQGCSSHSGRRTFITRAAKNVAQVGGSLRDVQQLAGHASLAMTQRYIEGDTKAKRKLVELV